jgi:hypothetical protein
MRERERERESIFVVMAREVHKLQSHIQQQPLSSLFVAIRTALLVETATTTTTTTATTTTTSLLLPGCAKGSEREEKREKG